MTLTLTDHCSMTVLPFHEGSKDDKVGLENLFFALSHIWLWHVLIQGHVSVFYANPFSSDLL